MLLFRDAIITFYQSPLFNAKLDAKEEGVAWMWIYNYDNSSLQIEFADTGFDNTISSFFTNRASPSTLRDLLVYRFENFKAGVDLGYDCNNETIGCNTNVPYFSSLIVRGCEPFTFYTKVNQTGESACFYPSIGKEINIISYYIRTNTADETKKSFLIFRQ